MSEDPTYTDEEREKMATEAVERVKAELPPGIAFVLVVATRTPDNRSRFTYLFNLPPRDTARLLTRAALDASEEGVTDVLASKGKMLPRSP